MKKSFAFVLFIVMLLSLFSGCVKKEPGTKVSNEGYSKKAALIIQIGGLGDQGYNDTCYEGMKRAKEEFGVDFVCVEPKETADADTYLRQLGRQGYGLVICMEFGALEFIDKVASLYPNTTYVMCGVEKGSGNLIGSYKELWDSAFIGGAVAAFAATDGNEMIEGVANKPGCKIGIVFGLESSDFYVYEDAFKHGARTVNPDCEVVVDYHGGFTDTGNVKNITENMINGLGCDVVWLCCGVAGLGGLQACRLNKALAIGVDADQDNLEPGSVITSIKSANEIICYNFVKYFHDGTLYDRIDKNNVFRITLASGGIGLTEMSVIKDYVTNQQNYEKLLEVKKLYTDKVINGEIEPWNYSEKKERYPMG